MDVLLVLYLPKSTPSVTYRPWAVGDNDFSVLRWFVQRIIERHRSSPLIIACHDETDRVQAEAATSGTNVFVTYCEGTTPLEAFGELAAAFPGLPIAHFRLESVFAPSDLLERVLAHHHQNANDFTFVADLPPLLSPEVVSFELISILSQVNYGARRPLVREAALGLRRVRASIRAEPFRAANFYKVPKLSALSSMLNRDDATRAQQVLTGLPGDYTFEAIEKWPNTTFEPADFGFSVRPRQRDRTSILYVSPGCFYSGAEECLRGLVQELGRMGFQQTAVVGAEGLLATRLRDAGCDVISANWQFAVRNGPSVNERFAREVLDCVDPDVIHCNDDPGDAFRNAARRRGIRMITHIRAVTSPEGVPLSSFGDADHYIAVSEFAKRRLIEKGICADNISVVYDGVDPDYLSPNAFDLDQMRREFGLPSDSYIVLMIGRPVPQKRHDLLLDAFFELQQHAASTRLVLVGDAGNSAYVESMRRKAISLNVAEHVTWLSFQEDIRRIHCACDTVVLPSDGDALGTCILEAMSLARPAVVSDSGGTHELLQHETSGIVVPSGDARSLAAVLLSLARNSSLRERLTSSARQRILERFTVQSHAEQVAEIFRRNKPSLID